MYQYLQFLELSLILNNNQGNLRREEALANAVQARLHSRKLLPSSLFPLPSSFVKIK
jgi:hypothetical protein